MSTELLTDSPTRSKRAFSYLRVSSPSQAKTDYLKDGLSIEVQRGGAEDKSEQLDASIEERASALLFLREGPRGRNMRPSCLATILIVKPLGLSSRAC
jgi:hypothetical protein